MLINLDYLINKYNISFKGILHVGAHECEELIAYEKFIPRDKILWVEAMKHKVDICKQRYPGLLIEQAVVSDKIETVNFNVSNNGQSSSMLELGTHKICHPEISYIYSFEAETKLLRPIIEKYNIEFNFLNLDIQGAELKALKGMGDYLSKVDYIYTEINRDYLYKECALVPELDEYLKTFGFKRVETLLLEQLGWGDAFYIKN